VQARKKYGEFIYGDGAIGDTDRIRRIADGVD
jgi:hypothetical protein